MSSESEQTALNPIKEDSVEQKEIKKRMAWSNILLLITFPLEGVIFFGTIMGNLENLMFLFLFLSSRMAKYGRSPETASRLRRSLRLELKSNRNRERNRQLQQKRRDLQHCRNSRRILDERDDASFRPDRR